MNRQNIINKIAEFLARFSQEVKMLNVASLYDINIHAENTLIPLLNEVYDLELVNANFEEEKNASAVDLVDKQNRIAFQVTSTADNDKVKHTLSQFIKYNRHEDYDILFVYVISEKQASYTGKGHSEIVGDKLFFDKDQHIIDNTDLFKKISSLTSLQKIKRVEELLELEFSDQKIDTRRKQLENPKETAVQLEKIFPNILQVKLPEYLYIASIDIDREQIIKRSWTDEFKLKMKASDRKVIKKAMYYDNLTFVRDWYSTGNQILTFRNLNAQSEQLANYVDRGTIERIRVDEYYGQDDAAMRNFVALLNFTFEELVFHKAIFFTPKENVFRFVSETKIMKSRSISWKKQKWAKRTVIFEMLDKDKQLITCFKHFAFKPRFQLFGEDWYLSISPTWCFTSDGYKKSGLSKFYSTGLKRLENNKTIYYAFLFITYCLQNMINSETEYPHMSFENPVFGEVASEYGQDIGDDNEDEEVLMSN